MGQSVGRAVSFQLDQTVMTRGISTMVGEGFDAAALIKRHAEGDWGDLGAEDTQANNEALKVGGRLFSSYETPEGKVWVITEADRSSTCVLLPSEY